MKNLMSYLFLVLFVVLVAVSGSLLTAPEIPSWYAGLNLPSWTPGGGFIGAVWTVLYILLALSAINFWRAGDRAFRPSFLVIFILNGILNAGWSYLFFHQHNIAGAFVEIWVLNLSTLGLIWLLWRKHRLSAYFLIPYFLWVTFATYLNYQILLLNS